MKLYLGLGKTQFTSNICDLHYDLKSNMKSVQIRSTERLITKKSCGAWPVVPLEQFCEQCHIKDIKIGENRDVQHPSVYEKAMDKFFPLYDTIRLKGLERFLSQSEGVEYVSHHLAHAYTATAMSPFEKCFIVVIDGAGSQYEHVKEKALIERGYVKGQKNFEQYSVYLMDQGSVKPILKSWQQFEQLDNSPLSISQSIGIFYETLSAYIFNSKTSAGKVMGLADFGTPLEVRDRVEFLKSLDWKRAFKDKTKQAWENSPHLDYYKDLAATAQSEYERHVSTVLNEIKNLDDTVENLILVGGSALNCTHNMKVVQERVFKNVYIPPFPGDEGIGFGIAHYLLYKDYPQAWAVCTEGQQVSYLGSISSLPLRDDIIKIFSKNYKVTDIGTDYSKVIELLTQEKIIAWYQGRSECGPRALGNRSILAKVDRKDLKNYLNSKIKFRESFRPYACSCIFEKMGEYFDIPENFDNSFMSFSVRVKDKYHDIFREVAHVDMTSRMQSVKECQNPNYYKLIKDYGDKHGVYALLNTSLNVMGEPIVETCHDMLNFMENTPVDAAVIEGMLIERK